MAVITKDERHWIREHLDIRHSELTKEQAKRLLKLMMSDKKAFFALGLYGFILNRKRTAQQKRFSPEELGQFCREFTLKVQLAARNRRILVSFPLFDLVGKKTLQAFGLLD
ncbi:MAG TPA: hypothetical protein PKD55_23875 [Bellilinea sp.]|nr:hypothetical protein [Bellilinea sp.]